MTNPPVALEPSAGETALTLQNGFVSATFDLLCPRLSALRGGARGDGGYGANVLVPLTGGNELDACSGRSNPPSLNHHFRRSV